MNFENTIREKQKLEKKITDFLKLVASMSIDELEIALAILADALSQQSSYLEACHTQLKGEILKEYYDLRKAGKIKQVKLKRLMDNLFSGSRFPAHPKMLEYENEKGKRDTEWKKEILAMSIVKRFFIQKSLPLNRHPSFPDIPLPEILIHAVAEYRLTDLNTPLPEGLVPKNLLTFAPK